MTANAQKKTPRAFLLNIQKRISSAPSSYLAFCFLIPVLLMYLIYLAMEIHPFGDGSVLVLDLNGQYVYFFEALRNAVTGDGSLLYSFYRSLGGEFMGMYAYYLASPLSYIVVLFPQTRILEALLCIILLKTGLCGLTFGYYLHKNTARPNKSAILTFSVMYALCAFAVVHQNNLMWTDALIWLPLLTLGIEQLIKNGKYKLFVIALSFSLMSNFYIGYMVCIYSAIYFLYYYFSNEPEFLNPNGKRFHFIKTGIRFGIFAILSAAISAVILFSAYYSLTFGKNDFSNPNWAIRAKFEFLDFFTKFLPSSYDTVRPEGLPFVYCGLLTLILVPIYFMSKNIRSREKVASVLFISVFILSFLIAPLDLIWHGFQTPNWLNYRYSFMLCFFLLVLAYKGFGNLRKTSEKFVLAICSFIILFVAICQKMEFETYVTSSKKLLEFQTVWLTVIATVTLLVVLCLLIRSKNPRKRESITAILAIVVCIEIFCSSLACVVQFDDDVVYSKYSGYNEYLAEIRPVVNYVKEYDNSFYRMEKLSHRKYNDNMALAMRGLSNSTSTLNASTLKFLHNMGYTSKSHLSQYSGGTPVSDSLLGIKYLIDKKDSSALKNYYGEIYSDEIYSAYYNPYALSVAYGVDDSVKNFDFEDHYTHYEKQNALVSAMLGTESTLPIYVPIPENSYIESSTGCTVDSDSVQVTYTPVNSGDNASFSYIITAPYSGEYFFYIPTKIPRETKVSVNGYSKGSYLGSNNDHIVPLGYFEKGRDIKVTVTLKEEALTVYRKCNYFWYLDKNVFEDAFSKLKASPQFIIDENYSEHHLTGKITTDSSDRMIQTSIPYDKGWQVYVDGEKVEIYETLNALMAFDIADAGEHTLELRYNPVSFRFGSFLSISGTALFIVLCVLDLVVKKLRKTPRTVNDTKWELLDFDEDYEEMQSLTPEDTNSDKKTLKDIWNALKLKKISDNNDKPSETDDKNNDKTDLGGN